MGVPRLCDLPPRGPCLGAQHNCLPPVLLLIREAQHCSRRGVLEAMSSVLCFPGIPSCDRELTASQHSPRYCQAGAVPMPAIHSTPNPSVSSHRTSGFSSSCLLSIGRKILTFFLEFGFMEIIDVASISKIKPS